MAKIKLTKTAVESAQPQAQAVELRDTVVPGFLCKITPAGRRVFMLQYRTNSGQPRKPSLGLFGELTVEQARVMAQDWLAEVRRGGDPGGAKTEARKAPTIAELCKKFMEDYSKKRNKPSTRVGYQGVIDRCIIPMLGRKKVHDVKRPDIAGLMEKLSYKQTEANKLLAGSATHIMLFGGSRSGKTFVLVRAVCLRAIKAPSSRHAIVRFRFNAVKNSIVMDTFPKVMALCFPGVKYELNKSDWYARFPNGSEVWFAGLDDKERTEKILGMEFVTIYSNECSQIPYSSVETAITRLAQKAEQQAIGDLPASPLKPRVYYDCNPSSKAHWSHKIFIEKRNPDTKEALRNPGDYASMQINPTDNTENLAAGYLDTLKAMNRRFFAVATVSPKSAPKFATAITRLVAAS